jgi:peptide/nickel transport system ATP-binding protein
VIVADEPVSALDVSIRSQVLNLMKRLQAEYQMASVVISHDLAVVKYLADRIGVMYLGKMVEVGSGEDIYLRPAHPYTEALIKTIPLPDPAAEKAKTEVGIRGELPSPINPPSGCRFRTRCPRAQDLCAEQEPLLRSFGAGHQAACHFPLQTPVESDEPALAVAAARGSEPPAQRQADEPMAFERAAEPPVQRTADEPSDSSSESGDSSSADSSSESSDSSSESST